MADLRSSLGPPLILPLMAKTSQSENESKEVFTDPLMYLYTCQTLRPVAFKALNIPPPETGEVAGAEGSEGSLGI